MKSRLNHSIIRWTLLAVILIFCEDLYGETGLAFLKMPASAGSAASMSVFSQLSGSPVTLFENPVGIRSDDVCLSFSHSFWFADISTDVFAFAFPIKKATVAAGFYFVQIPGIPVRDAPTDEPLNEIEAQYLAMAVGYSQNVTRRLTLGVSAKYLYENLYTETGNGYSFDISGKWLAPSSLDVSLLVQNLGKMGKLRNEATPLPRLLKIGIIRPDIFIEDPFKVSVGLNLELNLDTQESGARIGMELCIKNLLSISGGYQQIESISRKSVGFGIQTKRFRIEYALLFYIKDIDNPQIITFSWRPGK